MLSSKRRSNDTSDAGEAEERSQTLFPTAGGSTNRFGVSILELLETNGEDYIASLLIIVRPQASSLLLDRVVD